jgi:hypothetical protein
MRFALCTINGTNVCALEHPAVGVPVAVVVDAVLEDRCGELWHREFRTRMFVATPRGTVQLTKEKKNKSYFSLGNWKT